MKKIILLALVFCFVCSSIYAGQNWTVADLLASMQFQTRGNLGIDDSVWFIAVNDGQADMATTVDCTVDTHLEVLSAGTAIYNLPVDCLKLRNIKDVGTGRALDLIAEGDEGVAGTGTETEEPKVSWTTRGVKQMTWYPPPGVADTVMISYCKSPVVIDTLTDTLSIAAPFHPALIFACLEALYTRLERWDASGLYATKKINKVNNIEAWLAKPGPDVIIGKRVIGRAE